MKKVNIDLCSWPNIALIKYWGKKSGQTPLNPSLSVNLNRAQTRFTGQISVHDQKKAQLRLNQFEDKLQKKLDEFSLQHSWVNQLLLELQSENNFPHSCGIASSASSMSAFAKVLAFSYQSFFDERPSMEQISSWARFFSGSACRSIEKGWFLWGQTELHANTSDFYSVKIDQIHPSFSQLCDTILIFDDSVKQLSSTEGHQLMENHPQKNQRRQRANERLEQLLKALAEGQTEKFCHLVEAEALDLHFLMMTGLRPYSLLSGLSLEMIKSMWKFREEQNLFITFTIDAGPNLHLIYPLKNQNMIQRWLADHPLKDSFTCFEDTLGEKF